MDAINLICSFGGCDNLPCLLRGLVWVKQFEVVCPLPIDKQFIEVVVVTGQYLKDMFVDAYHVVYLKLSCIFGTF
jgi:hypothetical protein